MPSINQLTTFRQQRLKKKKRIKTPALEQCPQKKGVCIKVYTKTPKKPNSALRKVANIRILSTKKKSYRIYTWYRS